MTARKKIAPAFGAIALVIAMGQGCAPANTNTNNTGGNPPPTSGNNTNDNGTNTDQNNNTDEYTNAPCPTRTQRYVSSRVNITFCHPATFGNQTVAIDDSSNRVTVRMGDEAVRVMSVANDGQNANRSNTVVGYAADPTDNTITCTARSIEDNKGREAFVLVGSKNNAQTQDASAACINSSRLNAALNNEPIDKFFFYDNEEELILISGSQAAVLGDLTDDFEATIWPRN